MTEAVVNGKDTRCLFINNGDDLLTLKKVVSKKADSIDCEKLKHKKSKEINGNHQKTDSLSYDVDNTSSLEPNLEMDSDTDRNITIDSICTQEDRESENIDVSNENSNEANIKNSENQINVMKSPDDIPYSPNTSLDDNEYSNDLEDDFDFNNVKSPGSYFNISSRAPLHSNLELDTTLEEDIGSVDKSVLPGNEKKRKCAESPGKDQLPSKVFKLWNIMKYPFNKITTGLLVNGNQIDTSKADIVDEEEVSEVSKTEFNSNHLKSDELKNNSDKLKSVEKNVINTENKNQSLQISNNAAIENQQRSCCLM